MVLWGLNMNSTLGNFSFKQYKLLINKLILLIGLMIAALLVAQPSLAQNQTPQWQDTKILDQKVAAFLKTQSAGSPGKAEVSANPIDKNLKLSFCPAPQVFFPVNSKAWGKTTVGIQCGQPNAWNIYVEATVSIIGDYVVAANHLTQGQSVTSADLMLQKGDLTTLPTGFFTDTSAAVGRVARVSLASGSVVKQEMLKMPIIVAQGQNVRVNGIGQGFSVSTEGQALTNAVEGELVKVRVPNGTIISGIAKNNGQIEVIIR
jgi:flagella basal body P-ring formation protein FlgA